MPSFLYWKRENFGYYGEGGKVQKKVRKKEKVIVSTLL